MTIHQVIHTLYPDYVNLWMNVLRERRVFQTEAVPGQKRDFLGTLKLLLDETNPLYQSLKGKLEDYPELRRLLYDLLFTGKPVPYTAMNDAIEVASMFGFIKNVKGTAVISNRIFEMVLYNWFMSEEYGSNKINSNNEAVLK